MAQTTIPKSLIADAQAKLNQQIVACLPTPIHSTSIRFIFIVDLPFQRLNKS